MSVQVSTYLHYTSPKAIAQLLRCLWDPYAAGFNNDVVATSVPVIGGVAQLCQHFRMFLVAVLVLRLVDQHLGTQDGADLALWQSR